MSRSPGKRRRRPAPLLAAMPRRLLLRPRPRYRPSAAWLYRLCGSGRKPKGLWAGTTDNGAASAPTRHILPYDSRPIPRPEKQATSPAFPGRRISRADGPNLAFPGHFANKSSDFIEINPRSNLLSQKILQKNPKYFSKSTRGPTSSLSSFCKKPPNFSGLQPAVQALLGWLATRSVGLNGPNSAPC